MWNTRDICEHAAEALREEAARRDAEQSPYGLDSLEEVALHPIIAAGLRRHDLGVHAEQRYPSHRARRNRSQGDRCDLVVTSRPDDHLIDPLAADTLFGDRGATPSEALWIEIKTAHQFALTDGAAGPGSSYSAEMLSLATADLRKLARGGELGGSALLLAMFNADESVARHDLDAWLHRCLDQGIPIISVQAERFEITDRIGNTCCTTALIGVRPDAE
ncbi:MAG: hypothetical protein EA376_09875 [Phycisphaeraceae bacterium]|nr:MAG: hypothetical protein EA376_09875 [Phycisphaeraceae bacterium]